MCDVVGRMVEREAEQQVDIKARTSKQLLKCSRHLSLNYSKREKVPVKLFLLVDESFFNWASKSVNNFCHQIGDQ